MIIIGIDPGVATTGYGVIKKYKTKKEARFLEYGIISTPANTAPDKRLKTIYSELTKILNRFQPDIAIVEKLFFFKNLKTALPVSEARGVILLAIAKKNIQICEFTPLEIKMVLTGYGRADKKDIQKKVKHLLKLKKVPRPDDAADGLAAALCFCLKKQKINPIKKTK